MKMKLKSKKKSGGGETVWEDKCKDTFKMPNYGLLLRLICTGLSSIVMYFVYERLNAEPVEFLMFAGHKRNSARK